MKSFKLINPMLRLCHFCIMVTIIITMGAKKAPIELIISFFVIFYILPYVVIEIQHNKEEKEYKKERKEWAKKNARNQKTMDEGRIQNLIINGRDITSIEEERFQQMSQKEAVTFYESSVKRVKDFQKEVEDLSRKLSFGEEMKDNVAKINKATEDKKVKIALKILANKRGFNWARMALK